MKTNQGLNTVNIKGREYVQVHERISFFREQEPYKGWSLESEIVELSIDRIVIKAIIRNSEGKTIATGLAYEKADSSFINETSYIENCETSAWGRALGNLGIGIDVSIASSLEVHNAINNQSGLKKKLSQEQFKTLKALNSIDRIEKNMGLFDMEPEQKAELQARVAFLKLENGGTK